MGSFLKISEILLVFIGLPLLYKYDFIPFHKSIPLILVFFVYLIVLLRDKTFDRKIFGFNGFKDWKAIAVRMVLFFIAVILLVYITKPDSLFIIVKERPLLWLMIMLFYPLWSAYPQEIIYRAYFFQRFDNLFKNERWLIFLNAALFSFSHIIFGNIIALSLTFAGSLVFAYTYKKSRSVMTVFIEHALYGNIIFTVGLGEFFYLPL